MSDLNPQAIYFPGEGVGRRWGAEVGGKLLEGRSGKPRKFKTAEAAEDAAVLDAFLREDAARTQPPTDRKEA